MKSLEFAEEFGELLLDRIEWMVIGTISGLIGISIPSSKNVLFQAGDYGITGEYIVFWLSTGLLILSIIKILLGCIEGFLSIKQKYRNLNEEN